MSLLDLLEQVAGGGVPLAHFDRVAESATTDQLGAALAAAMRSDRTPPFNEMVGRLFGNASSSQQAGLLNQLLATLGPLALSQCAGGALGRLLRPGQAEVSPEQASQLSPEQVSEIAAHAEKMQPGVVDQVARFYAEHAGLIKTLGGAALAVTLAKMREHASAG